MLAQGHREEAGGTEDLAEVGWRRKERGQAPRSQGLCDGVRPSETPDGPQGKSTAEAAGA